MSFRDCGVEFHGSPQGEFYGGQEITGVFHIRQPDPKKIKGLYFKITGKSKTFWTEKRGSGKNQRTDVYTGFQSHVNIGPVTFLAGYPVENGGVIIGSGLSTFSFSFNLPHGIPPTFDGRYGHTSYKMKVVAERAYKCDKSRKFPFTVICHRDLNLDLMNREPIKDVSSKDFSSFFVNKGSLQMITDLPTKGYIPGQQIPIKCLVKNNSKVYISNVIFWLERVTTNRSSGSARKIHDKSVVEFTGQHVEKESESLFQVALSIPDMPPSTVGEYLITWQYFVKVRAVASGMHFDLVAVIPVTIGTIPLYTQTTSSAFNGPQLNIPSIVNYPSCPDLSRLPGDNNLASLRSAVPPFRSPQFPPLPNSQLSQFPPLPNSQLPQCRSLHVLPTPSAPPQYSDMEKARDNSGLPTYEEAQISNHTEKK